MVKKLLTFSQSLLISLPKVLLLEIIIIKMLKKKERFKRDHQDDNRADKKVVDLTANRKNGTLNLIKI